MPDLVVKVPVGISRHAGQDGQNVRKGGQDGGPPCRKVRAGRVEGRPRILTGRRQGGRGRNVLRAVLVIGLRPITGVVTTATRGPPSRAESRRGL